MEGGRISVGTGNREPDRPSIYEKYPPIVRPPSRSSEEMEGGDYDYFNIGDMLGSIDRGLHVDV